jgi:undecaprenyl-phosphate 4-deoxy-4-formamido-L-arabinose transferase
MNPRGVSVVVPVYNNASTLPELCRRLRLAMPDRPLEIVMVDDGSADDSLAVMRRLSVVAVAGQRNRGQNGAILVGLARAAHPICCVLDADLQDPPEALPAMLTRLETGDVGVVFSSRRAPRHITSRLFRFAVQRLFPTLPPHPCLCFAINADVRLALVEVATDSDYLPAVIGALRVPATEVAIERGFRSGGESGYAGTKRVRYAAGALWSAIQLRGRLALKRR